MRLKARNDVATDNLATMSQSSCDSNHFKNVLRTSSFRDTYLLLAWVYSLWMTVNLAIFVSIFTISKYKQKEKEYQPKDPDTQ